MPSADIAGVMGGSGISTSRIELARFGQRLKARRCSHSDLPGLFVLTDDQREYDWIEGVEALPRGAGVIVRHRDAVRREMLAREIAKRVHGRGVKLLIGGDVALALRIDADGIHFSERDARRAIAIKRIRPRWLVTVAAHGLLGLKRAQRARVDGILLSAAFDTLSHPERSARRFSTFVSIAGQGVNVVALGGVTASTASRLSGLPLSGIATIGGWFHPKS